MPGSLRACRRAPRAHESAPALLPRSSGGADMPVSAGSGVSGNGLARGLARAPRDETERLLAFQVRMRLGAHGGSRRAG